MINIKHVAHYESQAVPSWLKFEYSSVASTGLLLDDLNSEPTNKNRPGLGVM